MEIKRNEFLTDAHFMLIGNKIDLVESREVTENEAKEYAIL